MQNVGLELSGRTGPESLFEYIILDAAFPWSYQGRIVRTSSPSDVSGFVCKRLIIRHVLQRLKLRKQVVWRDESHAVLEDDLFSVWLEHSVVHTPCSVSEQDSDSVKLLLVPPDDSTVFY